MTSSVQSWVGRFCKKTSRPSSPARYSVGPTLEEGVSLPSLSHTHTHCMSKRHNPGYLAVLTVGIGGGELRSLVCSRAHLLQNALVRLARDRGPRRPRNSRSELTLLN